MRTSAESLAELLSPRTLLPRLPKIRRLFWLRRSAWHFRISLTLNGVGWNFLFVGATTLVTTCYRPSERGKAQALNDFLIFGTTASASFLAGFLQQEIGWIALNWTAIALVLVSFAAVVWLALQRHPVLRTA